MSNKVTNPLSGLSEEAQQFITTQLRRLDEGDKEFLGTLTQLRDNQVKYLAALIDNYGHRPGACKSADIEYHILKRWRDHPQNGEIFGTAEGGTHKRVIKKIQARFDAGNAHGKSDADILRIILDELGIKNANYYSSGVNAKYHSDRIVAAVEEITKQNSPDNVDFDKLSPDAKSIVYTIRRFPSAKMLEIKRRTGLGETQVRNAYAFGGENFIRAMQAAREEGLGLVRENARVEGDAVARASSSGDELHANNGDDTVIFSSLPSDRMRQAWMSAPNTLFVSELDDAQLNTKNRKKVLLLKLGTGLGVGPNKTHRIEEILARAGVDDAQLKEWADTPYAHAEALGDPHDKSKGWVPSTFRREFNAIAEQRLNVPEGTDILESYLQGKEFSAKPLKPDLTPAQDKFIQCFLEALEQPDAIHNVFAKSGVGIEEVKDWTRKRYSAFYRNFNERVSAALGTKEDHLRDFLQGMEMKQAGEERPDFTNEIRHRFASLACNERNAPQLTSDRRRDYLFALAAAPLEASQLNILESVGIKREATLNDWRRDIERFREEVEQAKWIRESRARCHISEALASHDDNVTHAAEYLTMKRTTLKMQMNAHNIQRGTHITWENMAQENQELKTYRAALAQDGNRERAITAAGITPLTVELWESVPKLSELLAGGVVVEQKGKAHAVAAGIGTRSNTAQLGNGGSGAESAHTARIEERRNVGGRGLADPRSPR